MITETKIDDHVKSASLSVNGYLLNRQDRTAHGGGVATYVSSGLALSVLTLEQEKAAKAGPEVTINLITKPGNRQDLVVVGVCKPPAARAEWFEAFADILLQLIPQGQLVIMGDLNADLMRRRVQPGKALREALALAGTNVHSTANTRITAETATCIDVIALD